MEYKIFLQENLNLQIRAKSRISAKKLRRTFWSHLRFFYILNEKLRSDANPTPTQHNREKIGIWASFSLTPFLQFARSTTGRKKVGGRRHFPDFDLTDQEPKLGHHRNLPDRDLSLPRSAQIIPALQRGKNPGQLLLHLRHHRHDHFLRLVSLKSFWFSAMSLVQVVLPSIPL